MNAREVGIGFGSCGWARGDQTHVHQHHQIRSVSKIGGRTHLAVKVSTFLPKIRYVPAFGTVRLLGEGKQITLFTKISTVHTSRHTYLREAGATVGGVDEALQP